MFTGIIEELGKVDEIRLGSKPSLAIRADTVIGDLKTGDSVAVNGVCMTVIGVAKNIFKTDVMPETLKKTDLGTLKKGDFVNLERALKVGDRLSGHMVSGHIDTVGKVKKRTRDMNAEVVWIDMSSGFVKMTAEKGSIAVDGVSLTVVDVSPKGFSISLIPHTMKLTTLGSKGPGSLVNIEIDMTMRYVQRLMSK